MEEQIIPQMRQNDTSPDLVMHIGDSRADADFSTLSPSDVLFVVEQGAATIVSDAVDTIVPADDNKSAIIRRAWEDGETATVGRCWVRAFVVPWSQTFPDDGPLRLDIGR